MWLREKMFGANEEFAYGECSACGCLQIVVVPKILGDYYDDRYYSFSIGLSALERSMCVFTLWHPVSGQSFDAQVSRFEP
jgi:hypothetical protein